MTEEIFQSINQGEVFINRCYAFRENGKVFLLSELGTSILLDDSLYELMKCGMAPDGLLMKLIQRGFAQTTGSPKVSEQKADIEPRFFMVTMTNACNLRCRYCFHQFLPGHQNEIQEDMLDQILEYIISYAKNYDVQNLVIQAWGGEPLLCMDRIAQIHDRMEESGIKYQICVETNGTLLTEKNVKRLNELKINIGISTDGMEQIQNLQRPMANGTGSYDLLKAGIDRVQKERETTFGSITVVTKDVLEKLEENIDFFVSQKMRSIKFNIARVSEDMPLGLSLDEVEAFAHRLVDKIVEVNLKGERLTEGNVVDRLKNLTARPLSNICNSHGCQGGKKMISFDTEGNIYPCEMTDYPEVKLGNIKTDKDLVELIKNNLGKGYFVEKDLTPCSDCPFQFFCGGGCTTAIIYRKGKVEGIDEWGCALNKAMYRKLIAVLLERPELVENLLKGREQA